MIEATLNLSVQEERAERFHALTRKPRWCWPTCGTPGVRT